MIVYDNEIPLLLFELCANASTNDRARYIYESIKQTNSKFQKNWVRLRTKENLGKLVLGQIFKQMARDRKHLEVFRNNTTYFLHVKQE